MNVNDLNKVYTAIENEMKSRGLKFNTKHETYTDKESAIWQMVNCTVNDHGVRDVNDQAEIAEDVYDAIDAMVEEDRENKSEIFK